MRKPRGYWDVYENVYNEALKYTSSKEFEANNRTAYRRACYHGWIKKFIWFKRPEHWNKKWDYETCKEESKKYSKIYDFQHGSSSAYNVASKNKWLQDYTWLSYKTKPQGFWNNYDNCRNESLKYTNRSDFSNYAYQAWWKSLKNGWIDDFKWLIKKDEYNGHDFIVYQYRFENAIYIGLTMRGLQRDNEHRTDQNSSVYKYSIEHGERIPQFHIIYKNLTKEEAQYKENELIEKYKKDKNIKLINKIRGGGVGLYGKGSFTKSKCEKIAKSCKSRIEFKKKSYQAWYISRKNGWINDYYWLHRPVPYNKKWTHESCKIESKKYKTRSEFMIGSTSAYQASWKNGWLDEFFPKNK